MMDGEIMHGPLVFSLVVFPPDNVPTPDEFVWSDVFIKFRLC